jgi:hypothetical protein
VLRISPEIVSLIIKAIPEVRDRLQQFSKKKGKEPVPGPRFEYLTNNC